MNFDIQKTLIVCPKSVVAVWPGEFGKHGGAKVNIVPLCEGSIAKRTKQAAQAVGLANARHEKIVLIINYEAVWQGAFAVWVLTVDWDMVVADEIHRIKSAGGKASRFMAKLGARATRRVGLTGTPMPHSPMDVYGQYRFLDPGIYGTSFVRFKHQFGALTEPTHVDLRDGMFVVSARFQLAETCKKIPISGRRWDAQNKKWLYPASPDSAAMLCTCFANEAIVMTEAFNAYCGTHDVQESNFVRRVNLEDLSNFFNQKFYSIAHRVKKADVLDLPPVIHEQRQVQLGPEGKRLYQQIEKEFIAEVQGGVITASNALARLLRLQQITSGFGVTEEGKVCSVDSAKYKEVCDILDDIDPDDPVVVFCRFKHDLARVRLATESKGRGYLELSGRINELATWQQALGGEVLGVQIQAGGVGIDLTRAAYCIYYSLGFSLGDYEQSLARLDRPGQTRSVTYLHLVAQHTVDEKVYDALQKRADVIESILSQIQEKHQ